MSYKKTEYKESEENWIEICGCTNVSKLPPGHPPPGASSTPAKPPPRPGQPPHPGQQTSVRSLAQSSSTQRRLANCTCQQTSSKFTFSKMQLMQSGGSPAPPDQFAGLDEGSQTSEKKDEEIGKPNPINTEFLYYSAMLKELAPKMSDDVQRQKIIPWIKKMLRPEYQTSLLQEKRNKYLMFMVLSVLNDEAYNILRKAPPIGALPDIVCLPEVDIVKAEWEVDPSWRHILDDMPKEKRTMHCSIHKNEEECKSDHQLDKILDDEFAFLLYMARPYAVLLKNAEDKEKVNAWFSALCTIQGDCCSTMRGIRNDYMMSLIGYIQELRVIGPFLEYPKDTIVPLHESAKLSSSHHPVIDPASNDVSDFLSDQPLPDDGAFCYIAVTGDLIYEGGKIPIYEDPKMLV